MADFVKQHCTPTKTILNFFFFKDMLSRTAEELFLKFSIFNSFSLKQNMKYVYQPQYKGDSTNKAKIENIFLLKLKVIFWEIFFMEFIVGIYVKVCTWLCPQKTPPRDSGEQFVHDDGQGSTTMDIYCPRRWTYEPRRRTSGDNAIKSGYSQDERITTMLQRSW